MTAIRTGAFGEYTDGGDGLLPMQILEANALSPAELQTLNESVPGLNGKSDSAPVNAVTPLSFDNNATLPRRAKDHTDLDRAHIFMTQPGSSPNARLYNLCILSCVIIGVLCTCFESIWRFNYAWIVFNVLQIITTLILLGDFVARFYVYPGVPKSRFWAKPENVLYLIGAYVLFWERK